MSKIAYPYLTLGSEAVDVELWEVRSGDEAYAPMQKYLERWDYQSAISVRKNIKVNLSIAAMQLDIAEHELSFKMVLRIGTGPGNRPRQWIVQKTIDEAEYNGEYIIVEHLSGHQLSQRLTLEVILVLGSDCKKAGRLAPKFEGAKVWEHLYDVALEGAEPRFPMETVSFSERFTNSNVAGSLWHLHWSPNSIRSEFGGSVRLYLNADKSDYLDSLNEGDRAALQSLMAGVMSQIIIGLIQLNDIQELLLDCEEGSVGDYFRQWLSLAFPGESIAGVRSKFEFRPSDFYSSIMSAADFGDSDS